MRESIRRNTSLQVMWALFRQHRTGMIAVFCGVMFITILWTFLQTPTYEAESRVLIRYGREYTYRPVDPLLKGEVQPMVAFNRDEILNTEIQIFTSAELIEKVISALGVKTIFPDLNTDTNDHQALMARAVEAFRKNLTVQQIKGSGVLRVSFQNPDPSVAVKVVKLLTDYFKERHLEVFRDPRMPFLESQLGIYRQKLEKSKQKLQKFMEEHHIISLKEQQKLLLQQYKEIRTLLIQGESYLQALDQKISTLSSMLENIPKDAVLFDEKAQTNDIRSARAQLLKLKLKEQGLLEKYKENNRLVRAVRQEIKVVEAFLQQQQPSDQENVRTGSNSLYQHVEQELINAQAERNAQQAKNAALNQQLGMIEQELEEFGNTEPELNMLTQEVEINEKSYRNFINKLEKTRILDAMDSQKIVNVVVIEQPIKPVKPIKPRKKINLLVGVILGAAASFAYALFYDNLFTPWKGKQDTSYVIPS